MSISSDYIEYATCNENALKKSTEAACVYCFTRFNPKVIDEWIDEKNEESRTAICPRCGIDSVIPNFSVKYTDEDLKEWHRQGFGNVKST